MNHRLRPLMLGGTGSDVGKSLLVAGLCRIFKQDGHNPAPFKAQNMALNSYVTPEGLELGRAQAVQAEAAGIECRAEMNPVLLKPIGDCTSQVIKLGRPAGNRTASDYFSSKGRTELQDLVHDAFDTLAREYNPVVIEGAGSIAEINLSHLDIVNIPMARYADAAVILVADIRRGGVFASAYGTIMLQHPDDRKRIKGVIINGFRGEASLFADGRHMLQELCGVPVVGVMPWLDDLHIEEEDSYFSKRYNPSQEGARLKVAVIKLRHMSNFTDFDPLERDPRLDVYYTLDLAEIAQADIVILPGTKATIPDLKELLANGVARAVLNANAAGRTVIGICGGYQMMGEAIVDPEGIEGSPGRLDGLGLLPVNTTITSEKLTRRTQFKPWESTKSCTAYEIHMGQSVMTRPVLPFAVLDDGRTDGCRISDRCYGTYMHGLFENSCIVDALVQPLLDKSRASTFDYKAYKESQYDRLADEMRRHIDIDLIYKIMATDD